MEDSKPFEIKLGPNVVGAEVLFKLASGRLSGTLEWVDGRQRLVLGFFKGRPEFALTGRDRRHTAREDVCQNLWSFALATSGRCLFQRQQPRIKSSLKIDTIGESLRVISQQIPDRHLQRIWQTRSALIVTATESFDRLHGAITKVGAPKLRRPPAGVQLGALVVGASTAIQRAYFALLCMGGLRPVGPPAWSEFITERRFSLLLLHLFRERLSGHLAIEHGGRAKHLRFRNGQLVGVASNLETELLGNLLRHQQPQDEQRIDEAVAIAHQHARAIGWGLYRVGLLDRKKLEFWLQIQARNRVFDLFSWSQGVARFYDDEDLESQKAVLRVPIFELLRAASHDYEEDKIGLTLDELLHRPERLQLVANPDAEVATELQPAERHLLDHLYLTPTAQELIAELETTSPNMDDALSTLSAFGEMGLLTFAQSDLAEADLFDKTHPGLAISSLFGERSPAPVSEPEVVLDEDLVDVDVDVDVDFDVDVDVDVDDDVEAIDIDLEFDDLVEATGPDQAAAELPDLMDSGLDADDLFGSTQTDQAVVTLPAEPVAEETPALVLETVAEFEPPPNFLIPKKPKSGELDEYQRRKNLERDGRHLLVKGEFVQARTKYDELVNSQPEPTTDLAYLALATLLREAPQAVRDAHELVKTALKNDADNALSHVVMSRVLDVMGQKDKARRHRDRATSLCGSNPQWATQVEQANWIGTGPKSKIRTSRPASNDTTGAKTWAIALLVFVGLFVAANVLRLGETEYFYRPDDLFFHFRRGTLLLAGILGVAAWRGINPLAAFLDLGWGIKNRWVLLGPVFGILVGLLSPTQRIDAPIVAVSLLTLWHVLAEEVFFRGFITRLLIEQLPDWRAAVMVSALIFGLYHLTFFSFWVETGFYPRLYWMAAIALVAGAPYAFLLHKSRGLVAPMLCHAATNLTMMWLSYS